jgi:hypothetical protein
MKYLWILLVVYSCLFLSSCAPKDVPTFEEYKAANPHKDRVDWDWEYGDLMYHADGRLRDQDTSDSLSAVGQYVVLFAAIWLVFFVWAGCCTRSPIGFIIVNLIGLILGIVVWCFF